MYMQCFWQGNHQVNGVYIYTVLANLSNTTSSHAGLTKQTAHCVELPELFGGKEAQGDTGLHACLKLVKEQVIIMLSTRLTRGEKDTK
jgi:hypothetical protein